MTKLILFVSLLCLFSCTSPNEETAIEDTNLLIKDSISTPSTIIKKEVTIVDSILTDERDQQQYKIRRFDGLWWMIDNVNIELVDSLYYKDVYIGRGSYHYNNDPKYGSKYGQLYDLSSALEACPNGWRLPSIREWEALNKKHANCIWDSNSTTGNYRDQTPSFEPTAGGTGYIYKGILPKKIHKEEDYISYSDADKYAYYWSQPDKTKPYFFSIDMEKCVAEKRLFQGASTQRTMAQRKFYSCRCVKEAK